MTTTPNLPPLPDEDGYIPILMAGQLVEVNAYRNSTVEVYALAAYQAGRNAGLEEAAEVCVKGAVFNAEMGMKFGDDSPEEKTYHAACDEADCLTDQIRALKSDTKGGV